METIANKITLLNETVLECLNESSEQKIIKNFTIAGIKILKANFGFAWLKKGGDKHFKLIYKSKNLPYSPTPPRKRGRNYEAIQSGKPYFVTQAKKKSDPTYDVTPYMKSYIIVPMVYKKKTYGNIVLCFKNNRLFSEEEKSLCTYLGNSAAQAITMNRLYTGLEGLVEKRTMQLKNSNLQLEKDKAEDNAILSSIGEGLIATDKEEKIILTNPQAEEMLGFSKYELLGKSLFECQPLVSNGREAIPMEQRPTYVALREGKRVTTSEYLYVAKNGKQVPLFITATPVVLNGKVIGSIQVSRDISNEREIDRVKTELISLASHQLRTPLSAINWYTESLVKEEVGKLNDSQKKYLQQIYHANQKMVEMVYDFLNVSRIELGTFSIKLSTLNVPEISQGVIHEITPLIAEKKLKVEEIYGKNLEAIEGDRKVIRLILQNLVTNAVKYTAPKGKIKVEIKLQKKAGRPDNLSIIVEDTGYGIPKTQQSKIFTKLFRADNVAKLDTQGSGLGLYLVKSFIDFCKGTIRFTSQENKGTKFYVTLPV
jgi:PAS domain S-box-containing protein